MARQPHGGRWYVKSIRKQHERATQQADKLLVADAARQRSERSYGPGFKMYVMPDGTVQYRRLLRIMPDGTRVVIAQEDKL